MESLSPADIALILGIDPEKATNTQDWDADTHDHYTISELVADGEIYPFRVTDDTTGDVWTKIPGEGNILNAAQVDAIFSEVMRIQVLKNRDLMPLIASALAAAKSPVAVVVHDAYGKPTDDINLTALPSGWDVDVNGILIASLDVYSSSDRAVIIAAVQGSAFASQVSLS